MNTSHTDYSYFHPPEHDNVEATVTVNFAKEWLRHDSAFFVSPRWMNVLTKLCDTLESHEPSTHISSPVIRAILTWNAYASHNVKSRQQWLYVKANIPKSKWTQSASVKVLDNAVRKHLCNSEHAQHLSLLDTYVSRLPKSMFHNLFEHAEAIGQFDTALGAIKWYAFEAFPEEEPIQHMLDQLRNSRKLWALMTHNVPDDLRTWWHACCLLGESSVYSYPTLFSHLLYKGQLNYWSHTDYFGHQGNVLEHIQRTPLFHLMIRHYAYMHNQMYNSPFKLYGASLQDFVRKALRELPTVSVAPDTSSKSKQILNQEHFKDIRVFGLQLHHFTDCSFLL